MMFLGFMSLLIITLLIAENISHFNRFAEGLYDSFGSHSDFELPENIPSSAANYFNDYGPQDYADDLHIPRPAVICKPLPGMSWTSLGDLKQ